MTIELTLDPNAANIVTALRTRLDKLTTSQQRMQRVNSCVRNKNLRGLKEMGYTDREIGKLLSGAKARLGGGFFPRYKLDNTAAQIRDVRAELEAAELVAGELPQLVEQDGYSYQHNALAVSFTFPTKPDKAARAVLNRHGFVRTGGFHYSREWSSAALRAAASVRRFLDV